MLADFMLRVEAKAVPIEYNGQGDFQDALERHMAIGVRAL